MPAPDWTLAYDGEDAELRDLIERAAAIAGLMQHEGWPHFCDYLLSKTAAVQRRLVLGSFQTMEEYKDKAGWLRGINDAIGVNDVGESLVLVAIRESLEAKVAMLEEQQDVDVTGDDDFAV